MVRWCVVKKCKNKMKGKMREGITLYKFPHTPKLSQKWEEWVTAVNRLCDPLKEKKFKTYKNAVLCSYHFDSSCFKLGQLQHDSVPSIPSAKWQKKESEREMNTIADPQVENVSPVTNKESCLKEKTTHETIIDASNEMLKLSASILGPAIINVNASIDQSESFIQNTNIRNDDDSNAEYARTPQTLRRKCYVGDLTEEDFMTPKRRKKSLHIVQEQLKKVNVRLKSMYDKNRRLHKENVKLNSMLQKLEEDRYLSPGLSEMIQNTLPSSVTAIIDRALTKKTKQKFCPILRRFALTLHFLSPSAYRYVRETFTNSLPHESTLTKWFQNIDGKSGFTKDAITALTKKVKAEKENGRKVFCNLVVDEIAIRSGLEKVGNEILGYVDNGTDLKHDGMSIATQAWFFMLVCINGSWKIPIGYFLIKSMDAVQRANIIMHCLRYVHDSGAIIVSLTFDGNNTNVATARYLGANLDLQENFKPWFNHPLGEYPVYILLDACHMLKLWRNTFACKILYDSEGGIITFKYIEDLHKFQQNEGFLAGNKIRQRHIQFYREKMKVSLAAQTLSKSVADALDFLNKDLQIPIFKGSEATVKFIRMANKLFDVFNSKNALGLDFKAPLSPKNITHVTELFDEAKKYISGLKVANSLNPHSKMDTYENSKNEQAHNAIPILLSQNKRGFQGFLVCIESFSGLYKDLIESRSMSFLLTYKFSQDHLEMFFSSLRSKGGWNNNPSVKMLIAAYKHLLVNIVHSGKKGANCWPIDCTTVLHCSSSHKYFNSQELQHSNNNISLQDHNYCKIPFSYSALSLYAIDVITYIAGFVVKSLSKTIDCTECCSSLFGTVSTSKLLIRKNRGGLKIPSDSVIEVCHKTELEIRQAKNKDCFLSINILQHVINVQTNLNSNIFFCLNKHICDQEPINNHKDVLIKSIIKKYIDIKICFDIKNFNFSLHKERVRSQNTKLTIFKNQ